MLLLTQTTVIKRPFLPLFIGSFLYLTTSRDIYLFDVGKKEGRETRLVLDNLGCERDLWTATVNYADAHLITGQRDALYFYNPEGRGQCYVFEVQS
jgi:hypothetical protein